MSEMDWYTAIVMDRPRQLGGLLRRGLSPATTHDGLSLAQWAVAWNSPRCLARLNHASRGWETSPEDLARQLWAQLKIPPHCISPMRGIRHASSLILEMLLIAGVNLDAPVSLEVDLPLNVAILKEHTVHWVPLLARYHQLPAFSWRARASQASPAVFDALIQALQPPPRALDEAVFALLCGASERHRRDDMLRLAVSGGGRWPTDQEASALPLANHTEPEIVLRWLPHVDFPDAPSRNYWLRIMADQPEEVWTAWAKDRPWIPPPSTDDQGAWLGQVSPLALRRLIGQGFCPSTPWGPTLSNEGGPYHSDSPLSLWERPYLLNRHWDTLTSPDLGLVPPWRAGRPESLMTTLSSLVWLWRIKASWGEHPRESVKRVRDRLLNHVSDSRERETLIAAAVDHLLSEDLRLLEVDPGSLSPSHLIHRGLSWAVTQSSSFWSHRHIESGQALCQRALPLLLATGCFDLLASSAFQSAFVTCVPHPLKTLVTFAPTWKHTFPLRASEDHAQWLEQMATSLVRPEKLNQAEVFIPYWSDHQLASIWAHLRSIATLPLVRPPVLGRQRQRPRP